MHHDEIELADGDVRVKVAPRLGGRIAQISVGGVDLLVGRDHRAATTALAWGAYPMVPWAGRIRDGRFAFRGRIVDLPRTLGGHAIHGVGFTSPWSVDERTATRLRLGLDLPRDLRWPFGGRAEQRLSVTDDGVVLELSVTAGDRAFPASIGWHPWWVKPDRVDFRPTAMYRRDQHGVAVDALVDVPPGPWDDCFVNTEPVAATISGVDLRLTSDCTRWVVFDERAWATCIEPQTGPPDAPNLRPHVLEPGATLAAWFRIDVAPGSSHTAR